MSISNIDDVSQSEDFYSVRSNISNTQSFESLYQGYDITENKPLDTIQWIGQLQDKRYDAIYNISQLKHLIVEIERRELELMKESTIQHSKLQDYYIMCKNNDDYVKNLAHEAAKRLGSMKYELKMVNEQVQLEQKKLDELENQLQAIVTQIDLSFTDNKEDLNRQRSIIEDQRDQQSKLFEDLEFKELETQSRFEEESEMLKRNIIEAQRKSIVSSRDHENKKLILDEQQINLMKETRQAMDQLESERNYCNQQVAYFQQIVNSCNLKIEELNQRLNVSNYCDIGIDQSFPQMEYNGSESIQNGGYPHLSEFNLNTGKQETLMGDSAFSVHNTQIHRQSLYDKLESLTEIVRMNLDTSSKQNCDQHSDLCSVERDLNSSDLLYPRQFSDSYTSTISLSDESISLVRTDSAICLTRKPTVRFESMSIDDSSSSIAGNHAKSSITDVTSVVSSNDENCKPNSNLTIISRTTDRSCNRRNKQSRPLTCFLPKIHPDFNLRHHIESCGHDLTVCGDHIEIDKNSCQGFLWKLSNRMFSVYRKRWFCFDQIKRELRYYTSRSKTKLKGVISFKSIGDVFVDHAHRTKGPQKLSFCIETQAKTYCLITAKLELVSLWVDVIFTGAEAYLSLHAPTVVTSILSQAPR